MCTQKLRHVAPLRRMQRVIFRGADKLPERSAESTHGNGGAFLQSHQYSRRDILLIERFCSSAFRNRFLWWTGQRCSCRVQGLTRRPFGARMKSNPEEPRGYPQKAHDRRFRSSWTLDRKKPSIILAAARQRRLESLAAPPRSSLPFWAPVSRWLGPPLWDGLYHSTGPAFCSDSGLAQWWRHRAWSRGWRPGRMPSRP
jgi:hypothetical protein